MLGVSFTLQKQWAYSQLYMAMYTLVSFCFQKHPKTVLEIPNFMKVMCVEVLVM